MPRPATAPATGSPTAAGPAPVAAVHPASGERRRGRFSVRDIALSFGVLIVPIMAVILLFQVLGSDPVTRVDPSGAYSDAESSRQFTVLRTAGLRDGWHLTAASTELAGKSATLRLGFVAPSGGFARVAESGGPADRVVAAELGGKPRSTGAEEIAGAAWLRFPGRGSEQALVSVRKDVVVVVTGTADPGELRQLAASLR